MKWQTLILILLCSSGMTAQQSRKKSKIVKHQFIAFHLSTNISDVETREYEFDSERGRQYLLAYEPTISSFDFGVTYQKRKNKFYYEAGILTIRSLNETFTNTRQQNGEPFFIELNTRFFRTKMRIEAGLISNDLKRSSLAVGIGIAAEPFYEYTFIGEEENFDSTVKEYQIEFKLIPQLHFKFRKNIFGTFKISPQMMRLNSQSFYYKDLVADQEVNSIIKQNGFGFKSFDLSFGLMLKI